MSQTPASTPLSRVRAGFSGKKDLIEKLKGLANADLWLDRLNGDKSWAGLSNRKLLRLHTVLSEVKERYGSREKLIDALVSTLDRAKDQDYKKHFATWPLPRLLDALKSAQHRKNVDTKAEAKSAEAKAAPAAKGTAKSVATAAKSAAKKPAAKAGVKKAAPKAGAPKKPLAKKSSAKK